MVNSPAVGGSSSVATRARVDLPQPLSPTTANVLPASRLNETPSTAFTVPGVPNSPPPTL